MWNSRSKLGGKALGLNASSSMPDLAHHNKINLPTPCHFHLQRYFLLVKTHSFLSISRSLPAWMACREPWAGELGAPAASEPHIDVSRLQLCGSPRKPPRFPSAHGKRDHTLIFPEQSLPFCSRGWWAEDWIPSWEDKQGTSSPRHPELCLHNERTPLCAPFGSSSPLGMLLPEELHWQSCLALVQRAVHTSAPPRPH